MEEKYYCKVVGSGSPKKPHATRAFAETEALRLHNQSGGAHRVEVLQVVSALEAVPGAVDPTIPAAVPDPVPARPSPAPPVRPIEVARAAKKPAVIVVKKPPVIIVKKSRTLA